MEKEFKFSRQELKAIYHDIIDGVTAELAVQLPNFTNTDTRRYDKLSSGLVTYELDLHDNNIEDDNNDIIATVTIQFFEDWAVKEGDEEADIVTAWLDVPTPFYKNVNTNAILNEQQLKELKIREYKEMWEQQTPLAREYETEESFIEYMLENDSDQDFEIVE